MHSWDAIDRYSQFHPRWFESAHRYTPAPAYLAVYRSLVPASWRLERSGIWYVATPPGVLLAEQGWKLHVSAASARSAEVLRRILPILRDHRVPFKFLVDPRTTARVNGKLWPRSAGGKFVAVYPETSGEFHRIGGLLAEALEGEAGPYVLSDRRWPGSRSVFYRYGGFQARSRLRIDGRRDLLITTPSGERVKDGRLPYWSPPEWVTAPFPDDESTDGAGVLCGGRFSVESALSFSNGGGVYRATDHHTGREVVLKEARPGVEIGRRGLDAVAVLEKEYRLLGRLAGTGYFVRPIAFFRESEHAFLAEEFVPGGHLGKATVTRNPLYVGPPTTEAFAGYLASMRGLWTQIARAIAAAHREGVVLADLSFTNIMVDGDRVRIVDLEAGAEETDEQLGLHTQGFASPRVLRTGAGGPADDHYALGGIIFGSLMLATGLTGFHPPARRRFLDELTEDMGLPAALGALVDRLMEPSGPYEDSVAEAIAKLPVETRPARLAVPAGRRLAPPHRAPLRKRVAETLEGITSYIHAVADTAREDRLFPADLMVFESNPLSVAFGAAGVLHALHHVEGGVPGRLEAWMLSRTAAGDAYAPSLYFGQSGIAWVLAELGHTEAAADLLIRASEHPLLHESPDLLRGAAGHGMACLKLWKMTGDERFLDGARAVGRHLMDSCVRDERGVRWATAGDLARIGYAYGGSGPSLFLLYLHLATGAAEPLAYGRAALDFELAQSAWVDGRFCGFPDHESEQPDKAPVLRCYWDSGSAGVGTTLVRYLRVTGDPALRGRLTGLVTDASRKYTVSPQLFHGLAGLGNFLLDVWEHTGSEDHLAEAWQVAEGALLFRIERPEGIAFPGEQAARESTDLATGSAGVGLFLHRLLTAGPNLNFVVDELLPEPPRLRSRAGG
ncbi:class III lanthionine synthetase LanKC [Actinomadura sp. DC4]|uniref:class III lanthionine synthetase LanKC n=1 Tax=Actinomadura sp. DC4 TaxID=3055069 RepID=UPI0025AFB8BB|nr:class III lanthionine synthetase LanKC [Actinomadura sp. DC4]MDN3351953.1 class III lanthionine synthetase LanKC [Actinomadura sp. DC4]